MKRILHTVLMLTMAVAMFAQSYPRKVTEEDIPSSERNKYFEQVENNIHNFYMLLLDLSDREMREEFISEIFMDNSNRHIPEFYLLDKKDQRLSPGQYLIELDKVISSFDRDGLDFQIENISHQPDMFMMNMRSCYVHSEYDLTLKDNGKVVFKRRCRITSFFPKASSYIRVKTMQVEPVRDIIAYKKPVTQTVVADNNQTTKKVKVSGIKVRECTESEIPYSRRAKYYDEAHRVVQDFYMLLLETVGNTDNRDVVIDQLINDKQATTLKTDFLLTQDHNLTFCSPMQYFTKFEAVYKDMVEEVEFLVDNFTDGKIMMNSLVSCYIPVEYDLTLTKGDEILFKRRCRMYCFFPKVSADKLVKVIQVEPVRDIIAYKKPVTQTVVADNNQTTKKVKVSGVITEKSNLDDIFKSNREGEYFEQIKAKAEQGDLHAQCKLGDLYMVGWPLSDKQYHRIAFEWYNKAAGQGSIEAMLNLGECYDKGIGVNKDYKIAFEYYY